MRPPNLARAVARAIHAVQGELAVLNAPEPPRWAEQSCTAAATQVNTADPPTAYRDARVARPYATGRAGFTGDPR